MPAASNILAYGYLPENRRRPGDVDSDRAYRITPMEKKLGMVSGRRFVWMVLVIVVR
jgi:hypothetical protein